jgi:hypothetical protein
MTFPENGVVYPAIHRRFLYCLAAKAGEWEWSSGYKGDINNYARPMVCRGSVPVMMKQ